MKKLAIVTAFLVLALPVMVSAQAVINVGLDNASVNPGTSLSSCRSLASSGVAGIVSCLIGFMNNAMYLIMAAAVLYTVWGAFELMKEEKREEAKNKILYGIIGLFVMISIWGLVNILDQTFNLSYGAKTPAALIP